jgi:lipid-binding SYLF domain-containing protein
MRRTLLSLSVLALSAGLVHAADAIDRLGKAGEKFKEVMDTPDKGIPRGLIDHAQCVIIVPNLKKGAFVFGGEYGAGFVNCRRDGGGWSAPAAIRIEGGSFGFQIGGEETDLFLLVMNKTGEDHLLATKFTLGADATATAGPVGRSTQAETDAAMNAELLTWSRARGLFAGISLKGATLRPDADWNKEIYGQPLKNREILTGNVAPPASAAGLMAELSKFPAPASKK